MMILFWSKYSETCSINWTSTQSTHHPQYNNYNHPKNNTNTSTTTTSSSSSDIKLNQQWNSTRNRSAPTIQSDPSNGNQVDTSPQEEIVKILRYLLWRQEQEDQYNKIIHDCRLLAQAIDKILFWIFLAITLTSSISFLVIIPIQRRGFSFASVKG